VLGDFDSTSTLSFHLGFEIALLVVVERGSGSYRSVVLHNEYWKICRCRRWGRNAMRGRLRREDGGAGVCRYSWRLTLSGKVWSEHADILELVLVGRLKTAYR
jgi:hypothetical protein